MSKTYLQQPVTVAELRDLASLASEEEDAFFMRNPHLVCCYRDRLLGIALCQGAALQFVGRGYGVADFDVHFFYRQNPEKLRLSRAVKHIGADVGDFDGAPIDFVRTVIPAWLCGSHVAEPEVLLQEFLKRTPTTNAHYLAEKAVVGLVPDTIFGRVVWG